MLRNREERTSKRILGVNMVVEASKLVLGALTYADNWIPTGTKAVKKKRGIDAVAAGDVFVVDTSCEDVIPPPPPPPDDDGEGEGEGASPPPPSSQEPFWEDNFSSNLGNFTLNSWTISGGTINAANNTARWSKTMDNFAEGPDYYVQGNVFKSVADGTYVGFGGRLHWSEAGSPQYYMGVVRTNVSGDDTLEIFRKTGGSTFSDGTLTQLGASVSFEWTDGDILRFELDKNTFRILTAPAGDPDNFTLRMSRTDTTFGPYIIGTVGIRSNSTTAKVDNFKVGVLTNNLCYVTLGAVTPTSFRVAFRTSNAGAVRVRYSTSSDMSSPTTTAAVNTSSTDDFTGVIVVSGLTANTTYFWTVLVDGVDKVYDPYPSLTTNPANGSQVSFSFASSSCISTEGFGQRDTIFSSIVTAAPKFMFCLGDNVYIDQTPNAANTTAAHRAKYRKSLQGGSSDANSHRLINYVTARRSIPWLYMWDDHELVNDYSSGPSTTLYANAKARFLEFVGRCNPPPVAANELYYTYQYGDVGFFVVDTRSFRTANSATDNEFKTIMGGTQKAALKAWLLDNNGDFTIKVIVSSVDVSGFGTTGNDGWGGGFTTELNEIRDFIIDNGITGTFWVTGDQHWCGIFKNPYNGANFYSIMASPLKQGVRNQTSSTNAAVLYKDDDDQNFGFITIDTTASPPTISFELRDRNGTALVQSGFTNPINITKDDLDEGIA